MSQLSGALDQFDLVDALQSVHQGFKSGILKVRATNGEEVQLHFHKGECVRAWSAQMPAIGEVLVDQHGLAAEDVARARTYQQNFAPTQPLGSLLEAQGSVTRAQLEAAINYQIEVAIWEMLHLKDGEYSFEESDSPFTDKITVAITDLLLPGEGNTSYALLKAVQGLDEEKQYGHRLEGEGDDDFLGKLNLSLIMMSEMLRYADAGSSADLILGEFVNIVSEHFSRGILFGRNGPEFFSLSGFGALSGGKAMAQHLPKMRFKVAESPLLQKLEHEREIFFDRPPASETWITQLGSPAENNAEALTLILPVWSQKRVQSFIYADGFLGGDQPCLAHLFQLAAGQTSLILENVVLRRALELSGALPKA